MAHFHSNALIGAGGQGGGAEHQIDRSLRFNDGDSAHLTRSFQAGNQKKWTWSSWIKRSKLGATGRILRANPCLLYTSPSPRDATLSRMPSSA